jgi:hypothetical protein
MKLALIAKQSMQKLWIRRQKYVPLLDKYRVKFTISLFMVHVTILPAAQTTQCQVTEWQWIGQNMKWLWANMMYYPGICLEGCGRHKRPQSGQPISRQRNIPRTFLCKTGVLSAQHPLKVNLRQMGTLETKLQTIQQLTVFPTPRKLPRNNRCIVSTAT